MRTTAVGLKPIQRQVGVTLEFLVCPDQRVFEGLVRGVGDVKVVLGEDLQRLQQFKRFGQDLSAAMRGEQSMWTHEQKHSLRGVVRGVQGVEDVPVFPSANVFDYGEGEELPYGPRSPFGLDRVLEATQEEMARDRGESAIPRTREAMVAHLLEVLPRKGRVVDKFIGDLAEVLLRHRAVLLAPCPASAPIDIPILKGAVPTRVGLRRRVPEEALEALNEEVKALMKNSMVVEVPAGEGGSVPAHLWVNGLVVAVRRVPPGSPPGTKPKVRMCVDCSPANAVAAAQVESRIPDMGKHVRATAGKSCFSSLDSPNSFHQMRLSEAASDLFGFCLKDMTGRLKFYKYVGAPFGFRDFPALFTEYMTGILSEAEGCPFSEAAAFIDDTLVMTAGEHGVRLDEVWGTAAAEKIVRDHLHILDKTLAGYEKHGLVINLRKCDFLQEDINVCGLYTDGRQLRVDRSRSEGWSNIGKPDAGVTLSYLQMVLGIANYVQGFLPPKDYMVRTEPLFALVREASRAVSEAAGDKKALRQAQGLPRKLWGAEHDEALVWLVSQIQDTQTRYFLDYSRPVHVVSDASDSGMAGLVGQYDAQGDFRICHTFCKRFTANQKKYSVGAREILGWVYCMRRWWKLLAFADCVFSSDHQNLVTSVEDLENIHLQRWVAELSQWQSFTRWRAHIRGECNLVCDTLSRAASSAGESDALGKDKAFSPILSEYFVRATRRARTGTALGGEEVAVGSAERAETSNPPPKRRAAVVAAAALHAPGTEVEERELVEIVNPHEHSLSPFMSNVLEAQGRIQPAVRAAYLAHKQWRCEEKEWNGIKVLFAKGRVLIPDEQQLLLEVFKTVHDENLHVGRELVAEALSRAHWFVPNFYEHFDAYYSSCSCQHARAPKQLQKHGALLVGPRYFPLAHIMMDFASLPMTEHEGKTYVGVVAVVDACSRVCQFTPVQDFTAAAAILALERWISTYDYPAAVHSDGGPHFAAEEFGERLKLYGIARGIGTPYHSRARGLVERLIGKLKRGIVSILPQGRLTNWPRVLMDLERRINRMPHKGLAGESPWDYLWRGHRQRPVGQPSPYNESNPYYSVEGGLYIMSPQAEEDLAHTLDTLRTLADWCGEIDSFKRAVLSEEMMETFGGKVGDMVLKYVAVREHALEPLYQGPFEIVRADPGDFYAVREVLAGNGRGPSFEVHASRLIKFDATRTDADREHARKLPEGYYVVEEIRGHRDGEVLVKWLGVEEPKWQVVDKSLQQVLHYKAYCAANGLALNGFPKKSGGRPKAAPSGGGATPSGGGGNEQDERGIKGRRSARCTFSGHF